MKNRVRNFVQECVAAMRLRRTGCGHQGQRRYCQAPARGNCRSGNASACPAPRPLVVALLVVLLGAVNPVTADAVRDPCQPHRFEGLRFTVCTVDLRVHRLQLYWKDESGSPYGTFYRLLAQERDERLVFAMNAGMYLPDLTPAGLYVENGEQLRRANTADGPGNFHMKPNGIFYVGREGAGVMETGRYLDEAPDVQQATQSGPMLVIDGRIHPRFLRDSTSRKRRNGVGVRDAHTVVFAITEQPVTFHEFARLFRDDLGADNALFLDGSMSSLYAPARDRLDLLRPMGPIIGAWVLD